MAGVALTPSARAFDAVAEQFDARYGAWQSVAAQRRAVRAVLVHLFPVGSRLLEIGGGTGEDAAWLQEQGRHVLLTDASPAMIRVAATKLVPLGAASPIVAAAEGLAGLADTREASGSAPLDGAFSNFAALNCVADLSPVVRALARLVRPGGRVALVLFGTASPGEVVVQLVRGDMRAAVRRRRAGDVPARLGGREFTVRYHRMRALARAFAPSFTLRGRRGIGIFVPPSAAEPWISRHRRLLSLLERLDAAVSRPLAPLGDHVLYDFERTDQPAAAS